MEFITSVITGMLMLASTTVLGPAALSRADEGVLERVAENRAAGYTLYHIPENWDSYDMLVAVEDCHHIGQSGLLVVEGIAFSAIVVDCQQAKHKRDAPLTELGLLADVNRSDVTHYQGVLILSDLIGKGNGTQK